MQCTASRFPFKTFHLHFSFGSVLQVNSYCSCVCALICFLLKKYIWVVEYVWLSVNVTFAAALIFFLFQVYKILNPFLAPPTTKKINEKTFFFRNCFLLDYLRIIVTVGRVAVQTENIIPTYPCLYFLLKLPNERVTLRVILFYPQEKMSVWLHFIWKKGTCFLTCYIIFKPFIPHSPEKVSQVSQLTLHKH